jgi:hypothetical protein
MKICRWTTVFSLMVIGCAAAALGGDLVVDGVVATTGGWYEFADGSIQSSAAYPRWAQVAIVDIQGRGDYTDPVTAMAALATWCGTPSESNPCLLKILPGYYDIGSSSLVMQPYVDIEGSGRNVTYIRAASSDAAVIVATYSGLRWLTVRNDGDGGFPQGIYIGGASRKTRVMDVAVEVLGDNQVNTGVVVDASASVIDSIRVAVGGGAEALGISVESGPAVLQNFYVQAIAAIGGGTATGIRLSGHPSSLVKNGEVSVFDGEVTYGILSTSGVPIIDGVTVSVHPDTQGWGFENRGSTATFTNSSIKVLGGGSATGVHTLESGTTTLKDVQIDAIAASQWNTGVESTESSQAWLEQVSIAATGGSNTYAIDNGGGSAAYLRDVTAEASGASTYNYGVFNQNTALITATNLIVEASGGGGSYGVLNADDGGTVTLDRSTVTGESSSVRNDNSSVGFFVGLTKLNGPLSTNLTCFGNYGISYGGVVCP